MENKNFNWTEDLIKEMIYMKLPLPEHYFGDVQKCLNEFKKLKEEALKKSSIDDYEILEFRSVENSENPFNRWKLISHNAYQYYNNATIFTLNEMFFDGSGNVKNGSIKIHSVRRIEDNEIFTVSDRLDEMEIGEDIIDGFKLNYKGNDLWISTDLSNGYGCSLGVAKKVKQPIPEETYGVKLTVGDFMKLKKFIDSIKD